MNSKKSYRLIIMFIFSIALLLSGCSKDTKSANSNSAGLSDKDKDYVIKLGYYDCDHMTAAVVAKDAGIFDELGLKVNVIGNGKVPEAMAAGQMDVGYVGNRGMMRAYLKGAPIMVIANNHIGGSYYLVAANDITDPQQILGKKLAAGTDPEKNSPSWINMARALGLPIEGKNYEIFNMADRDKYFALKAGRLDAFTCCDPWASMAEYEKAGQILAVDMKLDNGEWGECCAFTASRNFVTEHPELAKRMVLAHTKALQYVYTKPIHSAEIFAKNYNVPIEVALLTVYRKTVEEGRTLTWDMDRKYWDNQVNYELREQILDRAPDINEFLQPQYLKDSGAENFDAFIIAKVDPIFPLGMKYDDWKQKALALEGKNL